MKDIERAAQEALRLNHILLVANILNLLGQAHDLDDAKEKVRKLLMLYGQ